MRKAITLSLAVAFMAAAGGRVAMAADRAGIGFEYGMGPTIILGGGFDMLMNQAGAFTWNVSDNFGISISHGTGSVRGSHEYSDDTGANPVKRKIVVDGHSDTEALTIWASLPMLSFLKIGFELGTVTLSGTATGRYYSSDDGSVATPAMFGGVNSYSGLGGTPAGGQGTYNPSQSMMEGIAAKLTFLKGDSKTISADISVAGALRFVQLEGDRYIYGTQETNSTKLPLKAIDPITGFNQLDLKLVATIGF